MALTALPRIHPDYSWRTPTVEGIVLFLSSAKTKMHTHMRAHTHAHTRTHTHTHTHTMGTHPIGIWAAAEWKLEFCLGKQGVSCQSIDLSGLGLRVKRREETG